MSNLDIIRAWRNEDYRNGLDAQAQALAAHPAGLVELQEADLGDAEGGTWTVSIGITIGITAFVCNPFGPSVFNGSCQVVGSHGCCGW